MDITAPQSMLPADVVATLRAMPFEKIGAAWDALEVAETDEQRKRAMVRALCLCDLYYLLVRACRRVDMLVRSDDKPKPEWLYARVREVETDPDGRLDLWAREHYKSTVITFGLTIQDILKDSNITFGLFSHTRPIAKAFLRQIKQELETNQLLKLLFPDVLWSNPSQQSPKWSEDDGIIVRRSDNPKESTIEAWGLVDGQPTSKHFKKLLYDDVVVKDSVNTPEMITKTMDAVEHSFNLGVVGGPKRMAGTRFHFNDAYKTVRDRGTFIMREYPGRLGGTEDGECVYWSEKVHQQKRRDMGPYTYATQILLNPAADALQGFRREWLRHWKTISPPQWKKMNRYLLVDAASSKKKGSDYTAIGVIGLNTDGNYMVLDMVRDRLNLAERTQRLFDFHKRWEIKFPVRYERYGLMADIEHIKERQERENYRFDVREVGGSTAKNDRIKRLLPIFEQGRFWLPTTLHVTDYEKISRDLVRDFVEDEYMAFPVGAHDDVFDMFSRIAEPDMPLEWPKVEERKAQPARGRYAGEQAWMG